MFHAEGLYEQLLDLFGNSEITNCYKCPSSILIFVCEKLGTVN